MPKRQPTRIICGFVLQALAAACAAENPQAPLAHGWITLPDGYTIDVEVAASQSQREQGLMHRTALDESQGMLFVYPETARQGVWMKNTLLALDVVFLSERGKITEILENLTPCTTDPCPIYLSDTKAKYMLEVPAGFAARRHLDPDQELILEYRHPVGGD